jgi:hypothetical protein
VLNILTNVADSSTAGAISITTAVSITTTPFAAVFRIFRLFSFFPVKFKQIHTRNKKKMFEIKMPYWLKRHLKKVKKKKKKKILFWLPPFFDRRFRRR